MVKKSVISLISYDADYLPASIRSYYNYVDEIVLGLDENRTSWSGNKFSFDEEKAVVLYADLADKRSKLSKKLGEVFGSWIVEILMVTKAGFTWIRSFLM